MLKQLSMLSLGLSIPFLVLAIAAFVTPETFAANDKFRNGIHGVLGAPDKPYSFQYATAMLFAIPAAILIGRAFYAPKTSQTISLAVAGFPTSMIITSCFFGRTDACSMILLGTISLGLLVYGFQSSSKLDTKITS